MNWYRLGALLCAVFFVCAVIFAFFYVERQKKAEELYAAMRSRRGRGIVWTSLAVAMNSTSERSMGIST